MADVVAGNAELGATKQDLIAALVQRELAFSAKLMPYVTDVSAYAIPGAKTISFPKLTSFTVIDRTEAAAGDASALTASVDTLSLDVNAYVAYIIDAMTKKQANIQAEMEYAKRAAAAQGRYVDTKLLTEAASVAYHFQNVGADADVTYANLVDMQYRYLDKQGVIEQGAWWVSASQHKALISLTEFKDVSAFGEMVIREGTIMKMLGMPVVVHTGLAAKELYLVGKEGIAIGFQSGLAMDEQPANEYGVGASRVAMDQLFGVKGMQLGQNGAAAGKSPLVLGLND